MRPRMLSGSLQKLEPKARIEFAAVVFATAGETGDRATHAADAREFGVAVWTAVNETRRKRARGERQIVTASFIGDAEVTTGRAPFRSVRCDPAPAGAEL